MKRRKPVARLLVGVRLRILPLYQYLELTQVLPEVLVAL